MLKFLKKNKTFSVCLMLTILCFIAGILFNAIIDSNVRSDVSNNILMMVKNINKNEFNLNLIINKVFNNFSFIAVLWGFGMAVIGIPIVLFLYSLKVFMFAFEFISLFNNLHLSNILFIFVYLSPKLLNIIVYFILLYYSVNYSLVLFRLLFLKKNYNIRSITRRYLKILLFCLLCGLVTALFESLIVSKFLLLLV